jgi:hypothetical protein
MRAVMNHCYEPGVQTQGCGALANLSDNPGFYYLLFIIYSFFASLF